MVKLKETKIYKMLWILIGMTGLLIVIIIADNINMGYEKQEDVMTCDERIKTNEYLIKACRDSGSDVKITYFDNGKTVQSISCGGKEWN